MMKIKKIYLDMDGVLCDFNKRFEELFYYNPGTEALASERDRKDFSPNWKRFVETRQFTTLDWFPGGKELIQYVDSLGVHVEILSSSGGIKNHTEVRDQKIEWLCNQGLKYPVNIVPGRRVKKYFSYQGNVLIDDTLDVIEEFNQGPGTAILHKDVNETIKTLESLLNK
jgi:hypothetical protein